EDSNLTAESEYLAMLRPQLQGMLKQVRRRLQGAHLGTLRCDGGGVPDSIVMLESPQYRRFAQICRRFLQGLWLDGAIFQVSVKNVAQLYEYWCFFKIVKILASECDLIRTSM